MAQQAVSDGIAALRGALDGLLTAPLDQLPAGELIALLADLETQRNRLAALDQRVIAGLAASGAVVESGASSLPDLVSAVTRCSRGAARARVSRSVDLGPRYAMTGEPLDPIHPITAAAVLAGEVSEEQTTVIVAALGRIGPDAEPDAFEVAEHYLIQAARHETPTALSHSAKWVLAQLDPAGLEPIERTIERTRYFSLTDSPDPIGGVVPRGRLTAEAGAALRTVLDALAAPRPAHDGERDPRSAGQRYHDALLDAALQILRNGDLPDRGGVPASVLVHVRAEVQGGADTQGGADVQGGAEIHHGQGPLIGRLAGAARLGDGQSVSLDRLRPLLDECDVTTVVLSSSGGVLDYGRERRVATPAMRRALAARDGGCCFPGCDRPAAWTQAHHIWAWIDGGPTSLDNLCLLCAYHHRSFGPAGWKVIMRDGVPFWVPPPWLDPARTPIRNTARHLPRIDFGAVEAVVRR